MLITFLGNVEGHTFGSSSVNGEWRGGGVLELSGAAGKASDMVLEFKNQNVFSWLPAGQGHRAQLHSPTCGHPGWFDGIDRAGFRCRVFFF